MYYLQGSRCHNISTLKFTYCAVNIENQTAVHIPIVSVLLQYNHIPYYKYCNFNINAEMLQ